MAALDRPLLVVLLLLCAICVQVNCSGTTEPQGTDGNHTGVVVVDTAKAADIIETASNDLFNCRVPYVQLPASYIKLSIKLLLPQHYRNKSPRVCAARSDCSKESAGNATIEQYHDDELKYQQINHDATLAELESSAIDPRLPFVFFINGFNNKGAINTTWMHKVAALMSRRRNSLPAGQVNEANVVFLSWYIPSIYASSVLEIIPAYYKTLANYETVLKLLERALMTLVNYIEYAHSDESLSAAAASDDWRRSQQGYAGYQFYAHSLGSHLIAEAVNRVHTKLVANSSGEDSIKFGRIVGLDPAIPCFFNKQFGITAESTQNSTKQIMIVHSNAGLLGASIDRGHIEVVLNGGTFQPSCAWYDLACHHTRATDILSYSDDQCQMVAYKCTKYEQFKLGACETCASELSQHTDSNSPANARYHSSKHSNCVLVNLKMQHVNNETLVESHKPLRHMNYFNTTSMQSYAYKKRQSSMRTTRELQSQYHFVNTNPNQKSIDGAESMKTHCLQHYQLRLSVIKTMTVEDSKFQLLQSSCSLSSFYLRDAKEIEIQLLNGITETPTTLVGGADFNKEPNSERVKLASIVEDNLHTGLMTFAGKKKLFIGAIIDSIDLNSWYKCLVNKNNAADQQLVDLKFVLDIAFMSHTHQSVRHAYSSVLCGHWNPSGGSDDAGGANELENNKLYLDLCEQSELVNVSQHIDELLSEVKFNHQYDSWKISLLDSLFWLYAEWEPLRVSTTIE